MIDLGYISPDAASVLLVEVTASPARVPLSRTMPSWVT